MSWSVSGQGEAPGPNATPYDFAEAQAADHEASAAQKAASLAVKEAYEKKAEAEYAYRKKLAETITVLRDEGVAATVAADIARGEATVADLRKTRDIAEGVVEAALQNSWRCSADRKSVSRFIEWSMQIDLRTPDAQGREPAWS